MNEDDEREEEERDSKYPEGTFYNLDGEPTESIFPEDEEEDLDEARLRRQKNRKTKTRIRCRSKRR